MYDLISVGDTTIDTFLQLNPEEVRVMCSLDKEKCELCLNYADKIPVDQYHDSIAGNAANAAVSSARLGLKTAIWTVMGDDQVGKRAYEQFIKEKVVLEYFEYVKGNRSNVSVVINIEGERTILVYHEPKIYRFPNLDKCRYLYLTSMSKGSEVIFDDLFSYLRDSGAKLVYQPGTFQLRLGPSRSKLILQQAEVFFANKEESAEFTGFKQHEVRHLIEAAHELGPKIVVVTDAGNGSYASDGKNSWKIGVIEDVPRIEMTGAGDAYASAFTAALIHGLSVPEAMRWGSFNAASAIQKIGPQAGLLTKSQMNEWSRKYQDFKAKKL